MLVANACRTVGFVIRDQNSAGRSFNAETITDANGTQEVSREYLNYLYTDDAQRLAAEYGYRPSNESILKEFSDRFDLNVKLYTIKDYGGWNEAYKNYFDDGAMFDEIYGNE